ncbi:MAG: hypothetical protein ACF8Q5_03490 [Phycisphaerales bacterium JB040]
MNWKALALRVFLVSIGLTALAAITAVLFDGLSVSQPILFSSMVFAVHALGALVGAVLWQRAPTRRMVLAGVLIGVAGGLLWLSFIWSEELNILSQHLERKLVRVAGSCSTVAVALLVRGLVLWPSPAGGPVRLIRRGAWVSGAVASGILLSVIWAEGIWGRSDWDWKLFAIFLILSTAGTVGTFVVHRLTRDDLAEPDDTAMGQSMPVSLTCPRCAEACEIRANRKEACRACGLRLRVEFEEPRCACGYLLHGLTGDRCPECGRSIVEQQAWGSSADPTLGDGEPAAGAERD